MDGTNGKIIELLERIAKGQEEIRDEIAGTNGRVDSLRDGVDSLRDGVDSLREDTRQGFAQVNGRLDNVLKIIGGHHSDHEQRIRALEHEVFKKSG